MAPSDSFSPRLALFLSISGLGTNLVGAYGNSVAPTPHLDALASKGIVLDQFWADSIRADRTLQSLWSGLHSVSRDSCNEEGKLPAIDDPHQEYSPWREQIARGLLITDDRELAASSAVECFDRVLLVENEDEDEDEDEDEQEQEQEQEQERKSASMEFERLIEAAIGTWSECTAEHPLLWIHSRGLRGAWDAPYEYREMLCDEDDPSPPTDVTPMELHVDRQTDPDDIFGISCAVGGQVFAMDQVIGEMLESLREAGFLTNCLLGILGVSGYSLGEHDYVGGSTMNLYAESLHIPCLILPGEMLALGGRQGVIMQPHDLGEWIEDWFYSEQDSDLLSQFLESLLNSRYDGETRIGAAVACENNQEYVCSPAWSCRLEQIPGQQVKTELFAKPDDRWEQNEVASRAIPIVEKLNVLKSKLIGHYRSTSSEQQPLNWIDEELIHPMR
ncbi:Sulfatase [Pirellula sp. SH-Sr6A]|uniref:hypothetical protein n=1 Tax=Pirellula sp. SH-Sr6A TaxID=1632865 RepID=UPI00078E3AA7|nr:hypothetical protein [Pirellula sp. SH-Sr6A]AMV30749.1 Sulfatase [Pirellula sp. SH-Sr6A]